MVDFNNETTVGVPASDIMRILILERRYNLMEALEEYNRNTLRGAQGDLSIVQARLFSLYLELHAMMERHYAKKGAEGKERFAKFLRQIETEEPSEKEMLQAIKEINTFLDADLSLTRVDTRIRYDSRVAEIENQVKGL